MILFILILFFLLYYVLIFEPYNFKNKKISITIKNLPDSFANTRLVQISDLHSKRFGRKEKKLLKRLKKISPDYIFITGDIIDYKTRHLEEIIPFWQRLAKQHQYKVFCVLGNHSHANTSINVHLFIQTLKKTGIDVLINNNRELKQKHKSIWLIGVDDPHTRHDDFQLASQGISKQAVKILLAHSPEILRDIKSKQVDLILTGHTHGGQVRIPFVPSFWIPSIYRSKYDRGLFIVKKMFLYVNQGIGEAALPIRFNCSPEITIIKLKNEN
ncbi:metallophosphoesterase [Patescibacteria group bacterium]|nr:metallophosphoesterase [Patescibacteria group bacterium]